jgi:peptidylprolyl isomerase
VTQASTEIPATPPPAKPNAIPAPSDVAAAPADAKKTPSGLALKVLTPGKGKDHPGPDDKVTVHYTGWTTDGKMFDSSVARGEPANFRVSGVIKGWTEGLQLMTTGEKARLWIPGKLAYGDNPGQPGMPAGTLVFDVELIDFTAAPKPYSGWTTDGKMFDSSVVRGEPAVFPLNGVIKGWTEGVQLMVEGEKTRFWIPAELAYGSNPRPGAPAGQLTFDIELLEIQ